MNWLDIVIAIFLVISLFVGFAVGLVKAVFSIVGLFLAIFTAGRFYAQLAGILPMSDSAARITAYIILLLAVLIIVGIIAGILDKLLSALLLGWLNHLGGAVFGVFTGGLFCAAILAILVNSGIGEAASNSVIARFLLNNFPIVLALLPSEFNDVKSFFQ